MGFQTVSLKSGDALPQSRQSAPIITLFEGKRCDSSFSRVQRARNEETRDIGRVVVNLMAGPTSIPLFSPLFLEMVPFAYAQRSEEYTF